MEHQNVDIRQELKELSQETITLVRQELELLKSELGQKMDLLKDQVHDTTVQFGREMEVAKGKLADAGKKAGVGAGLFGGATVLGLGAFGGFTATLILGLGEFMPGWAGALVVTLLYGIVAATLAMAGRKKVKEAGAPLPQTLARFKDLVSSGANQIKSEVSPVPAQTVDSIKEVKQDVQEAWKQGGNQGTRRP